MVFFTERILTALVDFLNNYKQEVPGKRDYFDLLKIYIDGELAAESPGITGALL